jgi:hypothetical protein
VGQWALTADGDTIGGVINSHRRRSRMSRRKPLAALAAATAALAVAAPAASAAPTEPLGHLDRHHPLVAASVCAALDAELGVRVQAGDILSADALARLSLNAGVRATI